MTGSPVFSIHMTYLRIPTNPNYHMSNKKSQAILNCFIDLKSSIWFKLGSENETIFCDTQNFFQVPLSSFLFPLFSFPFPFPISRLNIQERSKRLCYQGRLPSAKKNENREETTSGIQANSSIKTTGQEPGLLAPVDLALELQLSPKKSLETIQHENRMQLFGRVTANNVPSRVVFALQADQTSVSYNADKLQ